MKLYTADPENFKILPHEEKQKIVASALNSIALMCGDVCMPAGDDGDNRQFTMQDLIDWVNQLTDCHCEYCS